MDLISYFFIGSGVGWLISSILNKLHEWRTNITNWPFPKWNKKIEKRMLKLRGYLK